MSGEVTLNGAANRVISGIGDRKSVFQPGSCDKKNRFQPNYEPIGDLKAALELVIGSAVESRIVIITA